MTTAMLKAYSHPLRRRLLRELARLGPSRAADLAEAIGKPANQISFHLRVLADVGWVEDAPELARDRRDRVWRAVRGATNIGSPEHPMVDEAAGAMALAGFQADVLELTQRVMAWGPRFVSGEDPEVRGIAAGGGVNLTRAEFVEMWERIQGVVSEFADKHDDGGAAEGVHFFQYSFIAGDETI